MKNFTSRLTLLFLLLTTPVLGRVSDYSSSKGHVSKDEAILALETITSQMFQGNLTHASEVFAQDGNVVLYEKNGNSGVKFKGKVKCLDYLVGLRQQRQLPKFHVVKSQFDGSSWKLYGTAFYLATPQVELDFEATVTAENGPRIKQLIMRRH